MTPLEVTTTSEDPSAPDGVIQVTSLADTALMGQFFLPKSTIVSNIDPLKPLPDMTTI